MVEKFANKETKKDNFNKQMELRKKSYTYRSVQVATEKVQEHLEPRGFFAKVKSLIKAPKKALSKLQDHADTIHRWKTSHNEAERKLSDKALTVIEQYNGKQHTIVFTEPAFHDSSVGIPPQEGPEIAPEIGETDLFRMRVFQILNKEMGLSPKEIFSLNQKQPEAVNLEGRVCLKQDFQVFPGETVRVSVNFERRETSLPRELFVGIKSTQTGFPDPLFCFGFALPEAFLPRLPKNAEKYPRYWALLRRKEALAKALLPRGEKNLTAKRLLSVERSLFGKNPEIYQKGLSSLLTTLLGHDLLPPLFGNEVHGHEVRKASVLHRQILFPHLLQTEVLESTPSALLAGRGLKTCSPVEGDRKILYDDLRKKHLLRNPLLFDLLAEPYRKIQTLYDRWKKKAEEHDPQTVEELLRILEVCRPGLDGRQMSVEADRQMGEPDGHQMDEVLLRTHEAGRHGLGGRRMNVEDGHQMDELDDHQMDVQAGRHMGVEADRQMGELDDLHMGEVLLRNRVVRPGLADLDLFENRLFLGMEPYFLELCLYFYRLQNEDVRRPCLSEKGVALFGLALCHQILFLDRLEGKILSPDQAFVVQMQVVFDPLQKSYDPLLVEIREILKEFLQNR